MSSGPTCVNTVKPAAFSSELEELFVATTQRIPLSFGLSIVGTMPPLFLIVR